jgi:hypothetical protein
VSEDSVNKFKTTFFVWVTLTGDEAPDVGGKTEEVDLN